MGDYDAAYKSDYEELERIRNSTVVAINANLVDFQDDSYRLGFERGKLSANADLLKALLAVLDLRHREDEGLSLTDMIPDEIAAQALAAIVKATVEAA